MKVSKICSACLIVYLTINLGFTQQYSGHTQLQASWLHDSWKNSSKLFVEAKKVIADKVYKYVNKKNYQDFIYEADKSYREWLKDVTNSEKLYQTTLWYIYARSSISDFINQREKNWDKICDGWVSAKDPNCAEFTRVGYFVWGRRKFNVSVGDIGDKLLNEFPDDYWTLRKVIDEAYWNGAKHEKLVMLDKKITGFIKSNRMVAQMWVDRMKVNLLLACSVQKMSFLYTAEECGKMAIKASSNTLSKPDKAVIERVALLIRNWKDKWK